MGVNTAPKADVTAFIDDLNSKYEALHKAFEDNFWATKMALQGNSTEDLTATKLRLDEFLRDKGNLAAVRAQLADPSVTQDQAKVLRIMEKTFLCYIMEAEEAAALKDKVTERENQLEASRNTLKLGYVDPASNEFVAASSVLLRSKMRTDPEEALRKACYEALCSIGPFVAEEFVTIVKERNRLAKLLGYEDFYAYKVMQAEGFSKAKLFEMLDGLEAETRPLMAEAREQLAKEKGGASSLEPWNIAFAMAGDIDRLQDPYFPFEMAPEVWGRSFARLGIDYKGTRMTLDLCDRQHKYSNGFCHWPQPPYRKSDGTWVPSQTNFTSLATPSAVGSGATALATLMHEGGHAAHFANIDQGSPLFSQERAPTSVAYAENQSMFLDSLVGDAHWLAKYARSREGEAMPWELVAAAVKAKHPYEVFGVRAMLAVPYFEKALYELPEAELTAEKLMAMSYELEEKLQGGRASRPLMSVPHILSDESSCYYHGYVLAEMAVQQTRAHFLGKYGFIVDNPRVGADLERSYWRPGNGDAFLELVHGLTGAPLTAEAWVAHLRTPVSTLLASEEADYKKGLAEAAAEAAGGGAGAVDLGMQAVFVHGDEVIADSAAVGGFQEACRLFQAWVKKNFPA